MAKRIILLDRQPGPRLMVKFVMWVDVPAARQSFYAMRQADGSAYKEATAAETVALTTGQMAELVDEISVEPGTTIAQVKSQLEARWAAFQAEVNAANPWQNYGTFWDGTAWTNAGVA